MSEPGADAVAAVAELRILVHRLSDEVAAFRRRALQAEGRVRELEAELAARTAALPDATGAGLVTPPGGVEPAAPADAARVAELERENSELRERLALAAERTRLLLERARFLRQQQGETPA